MMGSNLEGQVEDESRAIRSMLLRDLVANSRSFKASESGVSIKSDLPIIVSKDTVLGNDKLAILVNEPDPSGLRAGERDGVVLEENSSYL